MHTMWKCLMGSRFEKFLCKYNVRIKHTINFTILAISLSPFNTTSRSERMARWVPHLVEMKLSQNISQMSRFRSDSRKPILWLFRKHGKEVRLLLSWMANLCLWDNNEYLKCWKTRGLRKRAPFIKLQKHNWQTFLPISIRVRELTCTFFPVWWV